MGSRYTFIIIYRRRHAPASLELRVKVLKYYNLKLSNNVDSFSFSAVLSVSPPESSPILWSAFYLSAAAAEDRHCSDQLLCTYVSRKHEPKQQLSMSIQSCSPGIVDTVL